MSTVVTRLFAGVGVALARQRRRWSLARMRDYARRHPTMHGGQCLSLASRRGSGLPRRSLLCLTVDFSWACGVPRVDLGTVTGLQVWLSVAMGPVLTGILSGARAVLTRSW